MAKTLAFGRTEEAIETISSFGAIKWSDNKKTAIEELVGCWASNREPGKMHTDLMIAPSNADRKALNQLARQHLLEKEEICEREYLCETAFGKLYLSVGDAIEFRKKDTELGVENGMFGTLIKASPRKFVVKLQGSKNNHCVTYNPKTYTSFSLGYASTLYRMQGRTVERAYVLHSPVLGKEGIYVALTRHVKNVDLFVSKKRTKNIAVLKSQVSRTSLKETTLNYNSKAEIDQIIKKKEKAERINHLKQSDSMFSAVKGHTAQALDKLKEEAGSLFEKFSDRRRSKSFFNPHVKREKGGQVHIVDSEKEQQIVDKQIFEKKEVEKIAPDIMTQPQKQATLSKEHVIPPKKELWRGLSDHKKTLFKEYYQASDEARVLI